MSTEITVTHLDYDNEKTSTGIRLEAVAADGSNWAALLVSVAAIHAAIDGVCNGADNQITISTIQRLGNAPAVFSTAQRERKWLVTYQDDSEFLDPPTNSVPNPGYMKRYNFELGTADYQWLDDNSDVVYTPQMSVVEIPVQALVDALEADAKSPNGGNIVIVEIRAVGRNT